MHTSRPFLWPGVDDQLGARVYRKKLGSQRRSHGGRGDGGGGRGRRTSLLGSLLATEVLYNPMTGEVLNFFSNGVRLN